MCFCILSFRRHLIGNFGGYFEFYANIYPKI